MDSNNNNNNNSSSPQSLKTNSKSFENMLTDEEEVLIFIKTKNSNSTTGQPDFNFNNNHVAGGNVNSSQLQQNPLINNTITTSETRESLSTTRSGSFDIHKHILEQPKKSIFSKLFLKQHRQENKESVSSEFSSPQNQIDSEANSSKELSNLKQSINSVKRSMTSENNHSTSILKQTSSVSLPPSLDLHVNTEVKSIVTQKLNESRAQLDLNIHNPIQDDSSAGEFNLRNSTLESVSASLVEAFEKECSEIFVSDSKSAFSVHLDGVQSFADLPTPSTVPQKSKLSTSQEKLGKISIEISNKSKNGPSNAAVAKQNPLYKSMDPATVASMLYQDKFELKESLCGFLGSSDPFHKQVLKFYMSLFDFEGTLDMAMRTLCSKLKLSGETQVIDRVLFAFSQHYWKCNPNVHHLYKNEDALYVVTFSLILLNTDLHFVQQPQGHKKMTKKEYIKNTIESIEYTLTKTPSNEIGLKTLKRDIEPVLRDIYDNLKEEMLNLPKPAQQTPSSLPNSVQLPSFTDTSSIHSSRDRKQSIPYFSPLGNSTSRSSGKKNSSTGGVLGGMKKPLGNTVEKLPLLQGILRRKHLYEDHTTKARYRRWVEHQVLLYADKEGVDLHTFKASGELSTEYTPTTAQSENSSDDIQLFNSKGAGADSYQIMTLVHAVAHALPEPGYSKERPFVFHLLLNNGCSYLFECATMHHVHEWVRLINYWAGRLSREPLRGNYGSADHGWGFLLKQRSHTNSSVINDHAVSSIKSPTSSDLKTIKLEEWTSPVYSPLISDLDLKSQLASMRRVLELISNDIAEHRSFYEPMETFYAGSNTLRTKSLNNWEGRLDFLVTEQSKYTMYIEGLTSALQGGETQFTYFKSDTPGAASILLQQQQQQSPRGSTELQHTPNTSSYNQTTAIVQDNTLPGSSNSSVTGLAQMDGQKKTATGSYLKDKMSQSSNIYSSINTSSLSKLDQS